eukprot:gene28678-34623_t
MISAYLGLGFHPLKLHQAPAESSLTRKADEDMSALRSTLQGHMVSTLISGRPLVQEATHPVLTAPNTANSPGYTYPSSLLESKYPPWSSSIQASRELSYMPMFNHQLSVIGKRKMRPVPLADRLAYQASHVKPARIGNLCFECEKFRKVRLTYFDAGDSVQVFNTVWYPRYEYDLPILGIDLISLGKNRVLNVIDFQPLHPTAEYAAKYIEPMMSVKAKYPDLHGSLSGKIYNDTSFFSSCMLFGRFADESKISSVVNPAFEDYLQAYLSLMDRAVPNYSPQAMETVVERQKAYDTYSALKDPAVGLFDAYFGKEWSADFVHQFLFSLSQEPHSPGVETSVKQPVHTFKVDAGTGQVTAGMSA